MSNLVPTPRADKNGVVVTRHMNPQLSAHGPAVSIPQPKICAVSARESTLSSILEMLKDVGGSRIERNIKWLSDDDLELLKSQSEGKPRDYLDWTVRAFLIGDEHCGMAMVECHDFFDACYDGARYQLSLGMQSVRDVISEHAAARPSQFNVGNIKADFLMKRLRMHNDVAVYASQNEYYRDVEVLRANLDVVEPALPFLSMVGTALPHRAFDSSASVLDAARRFVSVPKNRYPDIAAFLGSREGYFDAGLVEQVVVNETRALYDGLL